MTIPKSCSTCEHRQGVGMFAKCTLSGCYAQVERKHPTRCGLDYAGWAKRLSLFERIVFYFTGREKSND